MEWWLILSIIFGSLFVLLAVGVPVAFAFLIINIAGAAILQDLRSFNTIATVLHIAAHPDDENTAPSLAHTSQN